jgi:hypothetical protein
MAEHTSLGNMEQIVQMLNSLVIRCPKIKIHNTPLRGRGLFTTSPIQLHEKIFSTIPLAYWPSSLPSSSAPVSSTLLCPLCYKSNQSSCADYCQSQDKLSKDIKLFNQNLIRNPLSAESKFSNLIAMIAYRISLELQFGYQNTFLLSHFFTFPLLDDDTASPSPSPSLGPNEEYKKSYVEHHLRLVAHLSQLGLEKQTQQFLTYEWYLRMVGVLNLNGIQIPSSEPHAGAALFDSLSFINHSCQPNVTIAFNGVEATVIALKEFSAGEELFIDYVAGNDKGREDRGGTDSEAKGREGTDSEAKGREGREDSQQMDRFAYLNYNYGIQCQNSAAPCSCGKYK